MRAGTAVGRGRALVEHVHGGVVAPFEALLEDAVLFPEREDAGVERGEVDARRHLAEPGLLVAHVTRFRRAAGRKADSTRHGRPRRSFVGSSASPVCGSSARWWRATISLSARTSTWRPPASRPHCTLRPWAGCWGSHRTSNSTSSL